jgi:hypothetical protein
MHFNKDSNKVLKKSAVLEHIVEGLDPELQDMVMTVSAKVGKQEKMMYPDRHRIPKIPADDYDKQTAVDVINLTRLILEYASDKI